MRRTSRAGQPGALLLVLALESACGRPEPPALGPAAGLIRATEPDAGRKCPSSVGSGDSSSGIMLEVDGPVWGVREMWLSSDGDFHYRSGETGESHDVFGLPVGPCDAQLKSKDVSALIDRLMAAGVCHAPESDAVGASARTLSVCVAAADSRCYWSATPANGPAWMTMVTGFVRTACARP